MSDSVQFNCKSLNSVAYSEPKNDIKHFEFH